MPISTGNDNFSLLTLDEDGNPPKTRISSANHAWTISDNLSRNNIGRENKRIRVYKAYKRFPPTGYSKIAEKKLAWQSDVNWGSLEAIVNNQKSSYYDIITERQACATIKTKFGNERERLMHSENITQAFDQAIREWPGYLYNKEQDIESMLLYGKGIGMWDSPVGWMPKHVFLSDLLFPDDIKVDFSNLEEFVVRRRPTPYELYKIIENREVAETLGWNVDAVIDAIRFHRAFSEHNKSREDFYRTISESGFNWALSVNQKIDLYEIYWREFDGTISKGVILQDYNPIITHVNGSRRGSDKLSEDLIRDQHGFLQLQVGKFNDWNEIMYMLTDSVGSGLFHDIKSQAEAAYVACRQYDFTMNSLVDAVRLNSMLMVEGQSPDATKMLKQMEWLPISVMPDGAKFVQNRFSLPVQESMAFMQFYMGDLYRNLGQYRIGAPTAGGKQRTKGEAELDAAESAKLSGTQIRRFNECETLYFRELYRRFVSADRNDDGYEYVKKFYEILEQLGTPKEAAAWKNITSVRSNLINGAGSPSFKLITAEKLVQLTSITPANEGQENAVKDAIAALAGRDNVVRYRDTKAERIDDNARIIGFENAGMTDVFVNPANFPVLPTDPHIEHAEGHFADLMLQLQTNMQMVQAGQPDVNELAKAVRSVQFKGAHIMAHVEFIAKDAGKKDFLKAFMQGMGEAGSMADQLNQVYQDMAQAEAQQGGQGMSEEDIKLQYLAAKSGIEIDTKQKLADISIGKAALSHAQRTEQRKQQGITQLALQKAKARAEIQKAKGQMPEEETEETEEVGEMEEGEEMPHQLHNNMGKNNYKVKYTNSVAPTNGSQYLPEVQRDRERVLSKGFDPEGVDYDYATAEKAGMLPDLTPGENFMHMGSVTQTPQDVYEKYKQYGLPKGETYMVLKGSGHPTHSYLIEGEKERGFEVKKFGDRYFSVPAKTKQTILGYPIVEPDEELLKWFKKNPNVSGMQWGAGKNESPKDTPRSIVLNPFSNLSKDQQMAVAENEAIRHFMDEKNIIPKFNLTAEQEKAFAGTQYGKIKDKTPLKQSLLARILTGDESAGKITPMQQRWADWLDSQIKASQQQ